VSTNAPFEHPVEILDRAPHLVGLADQPEFEKRRLPEKGLRARRILETGELDNNPLVSLFLNDGFGYAKLVDAIADDLEHAIEGVRLRVVGELRVVDLEDHVHSALQIETQLEGLIDVPRPVLPHHPEPFRFRLRVKAEGGNERPRSSDDDDDDKDVSPIFHKRPRNQTILYTPITIPRS
jgi:hypothetical protein